MTSAIVDLRNRGEWDPAVLVADAIGWPSSERAVGLSELVDLLYPDSTAERGDAVITPAGLDPIAGGVRRRSRTYQGPVFQVHAFGDALSPGDLLIPPSGNQPVLLVTDGLFGSVASASFRAVRPLTADSLWLWAVLNCQTGCVLRKLDRAAAMRRGSSRPDVGNLRVPAAPGADWLSLRPIVERIEQSTHGHEEDLAATWWHTIDLRAGPEWRIALATPTPEILHDGEPLASFCTEIQLGRPVRNAEHLAVPDSVPVTDFAVLRGNRVSGWAIPATDSALARPGDVLVAERGLRALARVVDKPMVIGVGVYVLRLREPGDGPKLVAFLNGQQGYARRRILAVRSLMPFLRRNDLARMPVPGRALEDAAAVADPRPLALRLEELLWS